MTLSNPVRVKFSILNNIRCQANVVCDLLGVYKTGLVGRD